jgi:hypothetical protein
VTSEPVYFGGERVHAVDQSKDGGEMGVEQRLDATLGVDFRKLATRHLDALGYALAQVARRLGHGADAIRSGGERQGSLSGEPRGELGEDRQVSVAVGE